MVKNHLLDGLVHLAIVLSILRTDIDNYYQHGYFDYPEVQDILLGNTIGLTQTQFHNTHNVDRIYGAQLHPKSIATQGYLTDDVIDSLLSLSNQDSSVVVSSQRTVISAWLVQQSEAVPIIGQPPADGNNNNDGNNNSNETSHVLGVTIANTVNAVEPEVGGTLPNLTETISVGIPGETESSHNALPPTNDLTTQEMDLIELLWQQDMDMGVPREMFDPVQRLELEKQAEMELENKRIKEKELELIKIKEKDEEERKKAEEIQNLWQNINYTIDGETGEFVVQADNVNVTSPSLDQLNISNTNISADFNVEEAMSLLEHQNTSTLQQLIQQDGNNTLQNQIDDIIATVENKKTNDTTGMGDGDTRRVQLNSQVSIEQRWQDVANLLALPSGGDMPPVVTPTTEPPMSALLQNVTMVSPATSVSNNSELESQRRTGDSLSTNSSEDGIFDLDDPVSLFPNVSQTNESRAFTSQSGSFIEDLFDDKLDVISLTNMTEGMQGSNNCMDDASSDSALSSMGSGSTSPNQDWSDGMSNDVRSPYDMLEGATGGMNYSPGYSKQNKFEYYDNDTSYDHNFNTNDFSSAQNISMNNTDYYGQQGAPGKMQNVRHNHTYTVEPGMTPRESRRAREERERQQRSTASRDQKRAKQLKVPFTIDEIIETPVEDFNELLQKFPLNDNQLQLIRDIRRRGKNKVAAQNCRKRKLNIVLSLEDEIKALRVEKDRLSQKRRLMQNEAGSVKGQFSQLYQEVFQSLRDDNGHPYNPHEYSLQQTADGNVFLVPRNSSAVNEHQDKEPRKRKQT